MESADREVQEFQSLLMQISTEPDNSKREQMESSLLQKLNSATFILLLKKILPDPKMIGNCLRYSLYSSSEPYPSLP